MSSQPSQTTGVQDFPPDDVYFGQTPGMQAIRQKIEKIANTDVPILIQGENGTGKELLARQIHARSIWSKGSFIKVNCAAIPGPLLESELFGYEKGAFTGANISKPGRVELADGGTLFLDEIGDLDLSLQAKLLQFLQDGRFSRLGDREERSVQARIICATSRQLELESETGRFRTDLLYRINVLQIKLPPLRDRRVDIPALADYFVTVSSARFQLEKPPLAKEILHLLQRHSWPGNIRELENCTARCVILGPEEAIEEHLRKVLPSDARTAESEKAAKPPFKRLSEKARRELEGEVILRTLKDHNWNRRKTAEALKISYRTLLYKLRDAGLPPMRQRRELPVQKSVAGSLD